MELKAEQPLAGEWTWDAGTGTATVKEGVKTLTLQSASVSGVWFACAPADLSGTKLTVKVITDKGNLFVCKDCVTKLRRKMNVNDYCKPENQHLNVSRKVPYFSSVE